MMLPPWPLPPPYDNSLQWYAHMMPTYYERKSVRCCSAAIPLPAQMHIKSPILMYMHT